MQRKDFKSKLFKKKIKSEEMDYWLYLYAEILLRLKKHDYLKCTCSYCISDKLKLEHLLHQIEDAGHIPPNPKANKFTGKGDCGRRLDPVA